MRLGLATMRRAVAPGCDALTACAGGTPPGAAAATRRATEAEALAPHDGGAWAEAGLLASRQV